MRLLKFAGVITIIAHTCWAEFDPSRFNFGSDWDYLSNNQSGSVASAIDYATIWLNDPSFNQYWHGTMLKFCKNKNIVPVFYSYIVAKASGLGDSDVGGRLDAEGGKWLRGNLNTVKERYENYAQEAAKICDMSKPIIWLMEPDYFQYCNGNDGVSYGEAAGWMNQMMDCVKKYLPNALFSLDISPWNNDQNSYISAFDMNRFSFMHTSGGRTEPGSDRIRWDNNNNVTWRGVTTASGKCIIADEGYGTGGSTTYHDDGWDDVNNLKNRIADGVVAVTQKAPKNDWGSTINSVKSSLSGTNTNCPGISIGKKYKLTVTVTSGGEVSKDNDEVSYDSGTVVKLTATPEQNFKFLGWSGDTVGSAMVLSVIMNKDWNFTATFVDINAKPQYPLVLNVTGSGIVKIDPDNAMYDSGTVVNVRAFTVNGSEFSGWGGALTGTDAIKTLTMNSSKTVTASFTGNNISIVNLVENGDFSNEAQNWTFNANEDAQGTGDVVNGEFKVALETTGTKSWHLQLFQTDISLEKDKKYVFSFNAYAQAATEIIINIGMPEDPYTSYSKEKKVELTTVKKKYEINFTMKEESTSGARVEFNGGLATSSWIVDDIELIEAIEVGTSYIPLNKKHTVGFTIANNEQVTISWYDHAGRNLYSVSGEYSKVRKKTPVNYVGSVVSVINVGGRKAYRKTVNLKR